MKTAIFPGSFDPIHEGHIQIIKKAVRLFDKIYVVITNNINKTHNKSIDERKKELLKVIEPYKNIEIDINENSLTVDIAKKLGCKFIIRGVRDQKDFQFELEMYDGNKSLDSEIETILFIADNKDRNISSSILKEIQKFKE